MLPRTTPLLVELEDVAEEATGAVEAAATGPALGVEGKVPIVPVRVGVVGCCLAVAAELPCVGRTDNEFRRCAVICTEPVRGVPAGGGLLLSMKTDLA